MSTDIAFLLGVLAPVAPGGTRLRVRLLTLALFDDLAALIVIAAVYSRNVSLLPLLEAIGLLGVRMALQYVRRTWRGPAAGALAVATGWPYTRRGSIP